jgi:hypothetical protein
MITLEDFTEYFFITPPQPDGSFMVGVQANHKDGRKFSHTKVYSAKEVKRHGKEGCKALTLSELLEKLNEEEQ